MEVVAALFAIAYVWLAARQNGLCWPAGFISTGLYTYIFWHALLPFQSFLNAYYMIMAVYGYYHWRQHGASEQTLLVRRWRLKKHLVALCLIVLLTSLLTWAFEEQFQSSYLFLDALIQVASMFATYLVTQKVLENWLYWIVLNSLSVWLFLQNDLMITAALYACYVGFAFYGFKQWRTTMVKPSY